MGTSFRDDLRLRMVQRFVTFVSLVVSTLYFLPKFLRRWWHLVSLVTIVPAAGMAFYNHSWSPYWWMACISFFAVAYAGTAFFLQEYIDELTESRR